MSTENTAAQPIESHKPSTGDTHQLAASQRFSLESNSHSSTKPESSSVSSSEKDAVKSDASQGFLDFSRNDPLQGDKQSSQSTAKDSESKPGAPKNPGEGKNPVEGKDGDGKNPAEKPPQQAPGGPVEGQTPGDKLPPPQAPGAPIEGTQGVTVQPRDGVMNPGPGSDDRSKEPGAPRNPGDSKPPIKDPGEAKNPGDGGGTQSQGAERSTLPQAPGAPLEGTQGVTVQPRDGVMNPGPGNDDRSKEPGSPRNPGDSKPPIKDPGESKSGGADNNVEKEQPKDGQAPLGSGVEAPAPNDQIETPGVQANQQRSASAQRNASPFGKNR